MEDTKESLENKAIAKQNILCALEDDFTEDVLEKLATVFDNVTDGYIFHNLWDTRRKFQRERE